jgi:hypothetical protein
MNYDKMCRGIDHSTNEISNIVENLDELLFTVDEDLDNVIKRQYIINMKLIKAIGYNVHKSSYDGDINVIEKSTLLLNLQEECNCLIDILLKKGEKI